MISSIWALLQGTQIVRYQNEQISPPLKNTLCIIILKIMNNHFKMYNCLAMLFPEMDIGDDIYLEIHDTEIRIYSTEKEQYIRMGFDGQLSKLILDLIDYIRGGHDLMDINNELDSSYNMNINRSKGITYGIRINNTSKSYAGIRLEIIITSRRKLLSDNILIEYIPIQYFNKLFPGYTFNLTKEYGAYYLEMEDSIEKLDINDEDLIYFEELFKGDSK